MRRRRGRGRYRGRFHRRGRRTRSFGFRRRNVVGRRM